MAAQPRDDFEGEEEEGDLPYLYIRGAGPVQVEARDQNPKDLEDCLVWKIREWSRVQPTEAFEIAVDEAVKLVEWLKNCSSDADRQIICADLDARVQRYLEGIHFAGDVDEPTTASGIIRRLVEASLTLYGYEFQQRLHGAMNDVRGVLVRYQMEIKQILIYCLCASLKLTKGDQQLGNHLTNLKSIIKEVGSLVSAKTEGKVTDLVKGKQLTKEVEDILTTVMSAVSKEVEVLISINMQQMKSFLNKKRDGIGLTIVAFSPRLTKMEKMSRETVDKFLTTFRSHPHTHRALVQLFGSELVGDMEQSAGAKDSGVGTAQSSKRSQYSEDDICLSKETCTKIGGIVGSFKKDDHYKKNYIQLSLIGEGGYGKLYKVIDRKDTERKTYAMKKYKIIQERDYADVTITHISPNDEKSISNFLRCCQEVVLQSDILEHPNIVKADQNWLQYDSEEDRKKKMVLVPSQLDCDIELSVEDEALTRIAFYLYGLRRDERKARGLDKMPSVTSSTSSLIPGLASLTTSTTVTAATVSAPSEEQRSVDTAVKNVRDDLRKLRYLCIYIRMEQYDEDLHKWLQNRNRQPAEKEKIVYDLLKAMGFIHSKGYSHADLHAGNILIEKSNNDKKIKAAITDFGLGQYRKGSGQGKQVEKDILDFGELVCQIFDIQQEELDDLIYKGNLEEARRFVQSYIGDENIVEIVIGCLNEGGDPRVTLQELAKRYDKDD